MLRYDDNWLVHHSTSLDDLRGYNSPQIIKKIENYKKHDYEYYRWQYLGEIIGLGSNVYNADTIQLIEELPDDPIVDVCLASDTGHQTSATAVSAFGITAGGKVILLDTYYYE
ncbi:phage terminase large subunit, partial [Pseudomonas azerbaijanoccidens]|nr:phage terminase large subunit [Pseudomonas azerbaijanoccidentalis]